jgi:hypothetical protein
MGESHRRDHVERIPAPSVRPLQQDVGGHGRPFGRSRAADANQPDIRPRL